MGTWVLDWEKREKVEEWNLRTDRGRNVASGRDLNDAG